MRYFAVFWILSCLPREDTQYQYGYWILSLGEPEYPMERVKCWWRGRDLNPGQKFQRQEHYQHATETTLIYSGIMAISRVRVWHIGKISRLPPRSRVGIDLAPRGLRPLGARSIPPRSLGGRLRYFPICPPLPHDIAPIQRARALSSRKSRPGTVRLNSFVFCSEVG